MIKYQVMEGDPSISEVMCEELPADNSIVRYFDNFEDAKVHLIREGQARIKASICEIKKDTKYLKAILDL